MSWKSFLAFLRAGEPRCLLARLRSLRGQLEATRKGSSTTVSGLVFAAYSVIFILSSIVGKYLPKLGKYGPEKKFFGHFSRSDHFLKELVKLCLDLYRH